MEEKLETLRGDLDRLKAEVNKAVIGQDRVVHEILLCLLAGGHALLEGAPGLGKTLLVKTLARCLDLSFRRIQFTPDLMPADITGTNVIVEEDGQKSFRFQPGPIFGNLVLADEINRATPKTQSALLEAMQERAVTVAGERHALAPPFFVLATQNPIEMEGTYPLPEAQVDRFLFKVLVPPPDEETLVRIVEATTAGAAAEPRPSVLDGAGLEEMAALVRAVPVAGPLVRHVARLVRSTQPDSAEAAPAARKYVRYGAGVRAAQAIVLGAKGNAVLDGRAHVSFDDIRAVAAPALRHRLVLNFEGEAEGVAPDAIVANVLDELPEVPEEIARLG